MNNSSHLRGLLAQFTCQLEEYRELKTKLLLYYHEKLSLEEMILYLRSNDFCSPANRFKFIDFLKLSTYCERNMQLLLEIRKEITETFSKNELFAVFRFRYKSLRFLLDNEFISIHTFQMNMTPHFFIKFLPELKAKATPSYIQKFAIKNDLQSDVDSLDSYLESKTSGFSPSRLKQFIKKDNFDEFHSFIKFTKIEFNQRFPSRRKFKIGLLPIEYAVKNGAINIFKFLIQHEIDIPLDIMDKAVEGGNIEIIHILEDKGIKFSPRCLSIAIEIHSDVIYNYLHNTLEYRNDIDQLMTSIKCLNLDVLIEIISERVDLFEDLNKFSAIFCAICKYQFMFMFTFFYSNIVPLFQNPRFDINYKYFNAIHIRYF